MIKAVEAYNDIFVVQWNGSVWTAACNGTRHARDRDAMRSELENYFSDCGEDLDDEDIQGEIDALLDTMRDGTDEDVNASRWREEDIQDEIDALRALSERKDSE